MQTLGRRILCLPQSNNSSLSIINQAFRNKQAAHHSPYNPGLQLLLRRNLSSSSGGGLLHHEWVINGNVLNDTHPNENNNNTVVFLHGLLGSGKNLRTLTKKLTERNPHLSALLLDLRGHGSTTTKALESSSSSSMMKHEPPHTFESCANDIITTLQYLDLVGPQCSPVAVVGHSFGGRLALEYVHQTVNHHRKQQSDNSTNYTTMPHPPNHTWILDSVPGQAHGSVHNVVQAVSSIPLPIPSKKHLQTVLIKEKGIEPAIAAWMTTNLRKTKCKTGFEFLFDLDVATGVLDEFGKQNFMGMLRDVGEVYHSKDEDIVENNGRVNLVMAGKNPSWTNELLGELEFIQSDLLSNENSSDGEEIIGTENSFLQMYKLPKAGHWVHVDDLEGLLEVMEKGGFCNK